jgi:CcmD family protein
MTLDLNSLAVCLVSLAVQTAAPQGASMANAVADPAAITEPGLRFLMGGYTVVWVILAAYILTLSVRLRRLTRQVRRLKERLGA